MLAKRGGYGPLVAREKAFMKPIRTCNSPGPLRITRNRENFGSQTNLTSDYTMKSFILIAVLFATLGFGYPGNEQRQVVQCTGDVFAGCPENGSPCCVYVPPDSGNNVSVVYFNLL